MLRPQRIVPPAALPISVEEVKAHARLTNSALDSLIEDLIRAAVNHVDGYGGILGRCLMPQVWRQSYAGFACCLRLPLEPVLSIVEITYIDSTGNSQTLAPELYRLLLDSRGSIVRLAPGQSWPATVSDREDVVSVDFRTGYESTESPPNPEDEVPQAIKRALIMLCGHWLMDGSYPVSVGSGAGAIEIPMTVDALLAPFKVRQ